jgi:hypothetical protein
MITLACLQCRLALRTTGHYEEVDFLVGMHCPWYPDRYPCPRRECPGLMTLTDAIASEDLVHLEIHDLTPQEAFQALQGLGLPSERVCRAEYVQQTVLGQTVVALDLQPIPNDNRCILHSLTLDSGYKIYLASSPQGAVVYRVAPPRSHVKEFDDDRL